MMLVTSEARPTIGPACTECPADILVIDRLGGPADVLVDAVRLLLDCELAVTLLADPTDALRALTYFSFDAVVLGVEADEPLQLAVLPPVRHARPEVPVLVVGEHLPAAITRRARQYGACETFALPSRAADLRAFAAYLMDEVLPAGRAALMPAC